MNWACFNYKDMNYEVIGKLIYKEDTQKISDRFQNGNLSLRWKTRKIPNGTIS